MPCPVCEVHLKSYSESLEDVGNFERPIEVRPRFAWQVVVLTEIDIDHALSEVQWSLSEVVVALSAVIDLVGETGERMQQTEFSAGFFGSQQLQQKSILYAVCFDCSIASV